LSDDLAGVSTGKKLTIQLAVSFMATVLGEFRITNLHGFLGIYEISVVIGNVISILFILLLINAFNFIDGINYLAGGIGLLVCISFTGFFWAINEIGFLLLSIGLCGSLIGFLYYNRTPARIFMGETGSLLLGFVIAVLAIRFMELSQSTSANLVELKSAPAILFGLLIIPLFDTARVFVIRILKGKSPFYGDRNHIHHRLLDIKLSHLQATMILLVVNAGSFCLAYFLRHLGTEILVLLISVYIIGLNWTLSLVTMHKNNKSRNSYRSAELSKTMDIAAPIP
jgi:UDP-N-acetylmuramyl pentapeptide phosphotransferase/UDP-N-acetylglucosamine-1-phosphate transferase